MSSRFAALSAIALVGVLVPASAASASTMTSNGTAVTFTANAAAGGQFIGLDEFSDADLTIETSADPVTYDNTGGNNVIATDCVDSDGTAANGSASVVTCTNIQSISADSGVGNDFIDAGGFPFGGGIFTITASLTGGADDDWLIGGWFDPATGGADVLNGGQGSDLMWAVDGDDELNGGDGDDDAEGGAGDDEVRGDSGDDTVLGDDDDDLVRGGDGDDYVEGGNDVDDVDGEDGGDQTIEWDDGSLDKTRGGAGADRLFYDSCDDTCSNNDNVNINQNAAADDGDTEEDPANDFDGFENLGFTANTGALATVVTGGGSQSIQGAGSKDNVTPGDGSDFVLLGNNDDTANTVDGFPDVIDCGQETNDVDTANVDQFDEMIDCEVQNVTEVTSAYGDPDSNPPSVNLTSPAAGANLPAEAATPMTAEASDDLGVEQVVFLDDSTILCTDTTAPYECDYQPTANDVGKNTLSAWAVDGSGQFGADFAEVTVGKFDSGLTVRTNKKDTKGRRKVKANGVLELPAGVTPEQGCGGTVEITIKDGQEEIRTRQASVRSDCTWSKRILLPPARSIDHDKVKVVTMFLGNEVLDTEKGPTKKTRIRT